MSQDWILSPDELLSRRQDVVLVDVREVEEFEESHIEGCQLIPLSEFAQRAAQELDRNREIVLYCAHGMRSLDALMTLRILGFEKVWSLEGGIVNWESQNKPVIR